jgi:hypothetical protein
MPEIMCPNTFDGSTLHELTEEGVDAVAPAGQITTQAWPGILLAQANETR